MELSLFLAQLIGVSLVLVSAAGIIRPHLISAAVKDFDHESMSTLAVGLMALVAGLAVVLSHNVWDGTWRVWVTLYGWAALLKGFTYLVSPNSLMRLSSSLLRDRNRIRGLLVVALVLGLYLAYKGFGY